MKPRWRGQRVFRWRRGRCQLSRGAAALGALAAMAMALTMAMAGCRHTGAATEQVAGTGRAIENKGSDTMVNLALAWAETYRTVRPEVTIAVTGGGTGTGIAALLNGTVDIANASRAMKEDEIAGARARGIEPVEREVSIDAIAVIVNLANPVEQLTIDDVSDLFTGRITNWRNVGGRDAPVVLVSRESNSGTHVYFLEEVVRRGDKQSKDLFATQTLLMPSSAGITSEVRRNPNAIGYDGLGYVTSEERALAIARRPGEPFVYPSVSSARTGEYALSRPLLIYCAGEPKDEIGAYLDWITGPEGQAVVERLGFVPIGRRADP
jgi:phosphate transport system substrate-binding protein